MSNTPTIPVTISPQPAQYTITASNGNTALPYITASASPTCITATGTISAPDFSIDGVSLKDSITAINERLLILVPDISKIEKYAALKAAYEHYKLLEKLCVE